MSATNQPTNKPTNSTGRPDQTSLFTRRIQDIALLVYNALNNRAPQYIKDLFNLRETNSITLEELKFWLCLSQEPLNMA